MKKILLIEDNREMRENTSEMLSLANFEVVTAENGRSGVDIARKAKPDLIICDIMMPELDGYEVLAILSKDKDTESIPFIFLTAKAGIKDMRKGMSMGADDYLVKPFDEAELLNAVELRIKRNHLFKKNYSSDMGGLLQFINEAKEFSLPDTIVSDFKAKSYPKKETIYNEGEQQNAVFFVNKGKIKTWKNNVEGKEFITGLFGPGEFFGYVSILEGKPYSDSATALEDCELVAIPHHDFLSLIYSSNDVSARFIKMLANNINEREERLLGLAYNSVRARVADALINLSKKNPQGSIISISRDDLAGIVGTSTESLIRTLSDFKQDKIIETDGRSIRVTNITGLEKVMKYS